MKVRPLCITIPIMPHGQISSQIFMTFLKLGGIFWGLLCRVGGFIRKSRSPQLFHRYIEVKLTSYLFRRAKKPEGKKIKNSGSSCRFSKRHVRNMNLKAPGWFERSSLQSFETTTTHKYILYCVNFDRNLERTNDRCCRYFS